MPQEKTEKFRQYLATGGFEILGTGFLIRPSTIITNRHVLEACQKVTNEQGIPIDQFYAQFIYKDLNGGTLVAGYCKFKKFGFVSSPGPDVGFIEFVRRPEKDFASVEQLEMAQDFSTLAVGTAIAEMGYPFGTELLTDPDTGSVYRFGPTLQQGFISALAPYEKLSPITRILLDIRTSPGMSGSPVFLQSNGKVVGIHFGAMEQTTKFAVPLTSKMVLELLRRHDQS